MLTKLSWNNYFAFKKALRYANIVGAIPCSIFLAGASASYATTLQVDPTNPLLGVDPMIWIVVGTSTSGALGAVAGAIGGGFLYKKLKGIGKEVDEMDKIWFEKVVQHRSDASFNSIRYSYKLIKKSCARLLW